MSALGSATLFGSLTLLFLYFSLLANRYLEQSSSDGQVLAGALRTALVRESERAISTGERAPLRKLLATLLRDPGLRLSGIRLIAPSGDVLVSEPGVVAWEEVGRAETVRLGAGGYLVIQTKASFGSVGQDGLSMLIGAIVATLAFMMWTQFRIARPLQELRVKLPELGEDPQSVDGIDHGCSELQALIRDFHLVGANYVETARTSKANLVALELAFEQLHAVLHSLGEGVLVSDPGGGLVMANPIAREILALDRVRKKGSTVLDLFPEAERSRVRKAITRAARKSNSVLEGIQIGQRIYNISVAPIHDEISLRSDSGKRDETRERAVAMVFLDTTEFHELNRMKDEFLSCVSHELRTPLTSIRSFAEILSQMQPEENEQNRLEFLDIITTEADRLTRIVNDVLDISSMEAGKMEFNIEPTDVRMILANTALLFSQVLKSQGGELDWHCEEALPRVAADRDRLHQVLTNLIGNAVKFLPRDGRILTRARKQDENILFSVEDSGPGIPEMEREAIFEKFRQGGSTLTDKPHGTGLGLPLCRQMLSHMGGSIWYEESTRLGGARFVFTLPVSHEEAMEPF